MNDLVHFRACIAGITFEVTCLYESTARYCADYFTDRPADYTFIITQSDLEREQAQLLQKKAPGQTTSSTPRSLEVLVLCRRIAHVLPACNRVLFHGSCLALDGSGVLFTAKSGTGKSTHTRLWREAFGSRVTMVNDDKPFLHIENGQVSACGTPWRGKHALGQNISVPLKAIVILCRGEENTIGRISSRDALPTLLQQTFSPEQPDALRKTLALVQLLSTNVPVYRLFCNMDPQAAITAKEGIDI